MSTHEPIWCLGDVRATGDAVLDLIQPGLEHEVDGQRHIVPREVICAWMSTIAMGVVTRYAELPGAREHEVEWLATAALLIGGSADAHGDQARQRNLLSLHGMLQPLPLMGGVSVPPGQSAATLMVRLYTWAIKRVLRLRRSPFTCSELARQACDWHGEHAVFKGLPAEEARSEARRVQYQALLDLLTPK